MYSGGSNPVGQVADNPYFFTEEPFSSPTAEWSASSHSEQTDSFAICDPYKVARELMDRPWRSTNYEAYMCRTGQPLDVLRAIFEIGFSSPAGSDARWRAVATLFNALTLADRSGHFEEALAIGDYIETLGYAIHVTVQQGIDNGEPREVTYEVTGPVEPEGETQPPPQEQPPAEVPPPARRRPPRPREQVAMAQEPPTTDNSPKNQEPVATAPGQESPTVPETSPADLRENGDSLALGFVTFDEIFAETANDERTAFLAERSKRRGTFAAPTPIGDDMVVAPLICGCSDGED